MATQPDGVRNYDRIRAMIDPGAGSTRVTGQYVPAGKNPSDTGVIDINLLGTPDPAIPSVLVYDDAENLLLGPDAVETWLQHHTSPDETESVMDKIKLALCYEHQDSPTVKRIHKYLRVEEEGPKCKGFPMLQKCTKTSSNACTLVSETASTNIHRADNDGDRERYWTELPIELQIAVPAHWDALQRGVLVQAARDAGFKDVNTRLEPLCGAIEVILRWISEQHLKDGDMVLFIDCGCSTTDVATILIKRIPGHRPILIVVGPTDGADAGGQTINDEAWKRLSIAECVDGVTSYQDFLNQLDITEPHCSYQFNQGFESCKANYPTKGNYFIAIHSRGNRKKVKVISLTKEFMRECFDALIEKVAAVVSKHLLSNKVERRAAIFSGGNAQNVSIRDGVKDHLASQELRMFWDHKNHTNSVAKGALELYLQNEVHRLKQRKSYHIAMDPFPAKEDDTKVLALLYAVEPGGRDKSYCLGMTLRLRVKELFRLDLVIVSSSKKNLDCKEVKLEEQESSSDIEQWPLVSVDLPDLAVAGFVPQCDIDGSAIYIVKTMLRMSRTNERLAINVQILRPDADYRFLKGGGFRVDDRVPTIDWHRELEVWHNQRGYSVLNRGEPDQVRQQHEGKKRNGSDLPREGKRRSTRLAGPRGEGKEDNSPANPPQAPKDQGQVPLPSTAPSANMAEGTAEREDSRGGQSGVEQFHGAGSIVKRLDGLSFQPLILGRQDEAEKY